MTEFFSVIGGTRLFSHQKPLNLMTAMYCVDSDWNIQRIVSGFWAEHMAGVSAVRSIRFYTFLQVLDFAYSRTFLRIPV